ncbi:MAG: hypothetical protein IMW90_22460 [Thermogemmatispora sp.]|jgi:hypothetical protein|uniref:hypothetical protein n=1 Tax=Thermogemmatispora sp. TaxID=1968838 RepID=UPI001A05C8DB|nr:hypothetical protein [Thermogemmatispora sp.]MBE3568488.1 hypothetical protein [Thermogemmatispora sp.]
MRRSLRAWMAFWRRRLRALRTATAAPEEPLLPQERLPAPPPEEPLSRRERMEQLIETFDEDQESILVRAVVFLFTVLFTVGSVILAGCIGIAIAAAIVGPWRADAEVVGVYLMAIFIEEAFAALVLAIARAIGRSQQERRMVWLLFAAISLFVCFAIGGAYTQYWLLSELAPGGVRPAEQTMILFRSIAPSLFDVAAAVFMAIYSRKTLEKFLAQQAKKEEAIESLSRAEIRIEEAFNEAEIRRQQREEEMALRRRREEVLNRIEGKIGEAAVTVVESTVERLQLPAPGQGGQSTLRRIL